MGAFSCARAGRNVLDRGCQILVLVSGEFSSGRSTSACRASVSVDLGFFISTAEFVSGACSCLSCLLWAFLPCRLQCSGLLHSVVLLFCSVCSVRHFPCCCSDLRRFPHFAMSLFSLLLLPVLCLFLVGFSWVFRVFFFAFCAAYPSFGPRFRLSLVVW